MAELPPPVAAPDDVAAHLTRLERRAQRERMARHEAESLLEAKSRELYAANQQLSQLAAGLEARVEERTRELDAARRQALDLAERDQLTGLSNRARFARALDATVASAHETGQRYALFLIDLDRFKDINDTLGHEAGDVYLRHVAARLRRVAPGADVVARLGGDEFAAIVPVGAGRQALDGLAQALIAAIRQPVPYRDRILEASASIGVATVPGDAASARELQRNADIALYRSKQSRSTYTLFDPALMREIEARQSLAADLVLALREGGIEAWFQPIVDGASRRTVGVEALARWNHPTRGLLGPAAFLDLAEESGLMHDLFACMMRSACPQARRWIEAGAIATLSVNLSPSQFKLGSIAEDVGALLRELDFPASSLIVEITEEVLVQDMERATRQIESLAAQGVRIALDDFGIGYSNFAYLRHLPIHEIKLDRTLTADVAGDHRVRTMLGAIVEIARAFELDLVAEGVEEQAQALWLAHLGCRHLQGYLFGRPMQAQDLDRAHGLAAAAPALRRA